MEISQIYAGSIQRNFWKQKRRKKAKSSNPWPLDSEVIALPLCCLQTSALSQFSLVWMVLKHNSKSYFIESQLNGIRRPTYRKLTALNLTNLTCIIARLPFSLLPLYLSLPPSLSLFSRSFSQSLSPTLSVSTVSRLASAKRVEHIITATWTCLAFQWPST